MKDKEKNMESLRKSLRQAQKRIEELTIHEEVFNQFRRFAEKAEDICYRLHLLPELSFEYISPAITKISGYPPGTFYEDPNRIFQILHPEDRPVFEKMLRDPKKHEKPVTLRWIRKDGTVIWTERRIVPIEDGQGNVWAIEGIVRDVTDRIQAQILLEKSNEELEDQIRDRTEELEQSERTLRTLLNATTDAAYLIDAQGTILQISEEGARALHKPVEKLIGSNYYDQLPDQRAQWERKIDEDLLKAGGARRFDEQRDGRFFQIRRHPIRDTVRGHLMAIFEQDVTEMIFTEQALKESEAKYRLLAENATDVIWTRDMDLRLTYISPSVERLRGYTPQEVISQTVEQSMTPQSAELSRRVLAEELAREADGSADPARSRTLEIEMNRRDGATVWTEVTMSFIRNTEKQLTGMLGISRDITERKMAVRALRESEETFRALAENSYDTIMRFDRNFRHLYVNPIITSQTGIPAEEFFGKTHAELGFPEHLVQIWEKAIEQVFHTKAGHRIDFELPTGIWIDWLLIPEFSPGGEVKAVITSARDITDRKRAEAALRKMDHAIQSAINAIAMLDLDGRLTFVNPAFVTLWKLPNADQAIGQPIWRFWQSKEDALRIMTTLKESKTWFGELVGLRQDRSTFHVQTSASLIIGEQGDPLGMMASFVDITEQKRVVQEMRQLEKQLFQAQKMETMGTLAGGIAHDINNILQTIFNNTFLAREEIPAEHPVQVQVQGILQAGRRAKDLVEQILTFSRQIEREHRPIILATLIKEVIKTLLPTTPSSISIQSRIDPHCAAILADPTQMHQVAMNLINNAVHAMRENGGTLDVHLEQAERVRDDETLPSELPEGKYVLFSVRDTGHGMDEATLGRIFEPFFTTKQVGEGTGLGLSVAHGIVVAHGGRIVAHSQVGRGSTFDVYLPSVDEPLSEAQPKVTATAPFGGTEAVLFIDDDPDQARLGKLLLERCGYQAESATSGRDALDRFRSKPEAYDLIIVDQMMPGQTGIELVREVQRLRPGFPVVLMTGKADEETLRKASEAGIDEVLAKPFNPVDLNRVIRQILDGQEDPT